MIDFHSHILPRLDDGAKSTEESVALLDMLEKQGVNHVFATPHFLPEKEALHEFIRQRDEAYASLLDVYSGGVSISVGAEVAYFRGITRIAEIESLKLSGTELLLLEMPMMPWSSYMTKELIELAYSTKTVPVIAHIERCMAYQKPAVLWDMIESGVLMQANATFFADVKTKRKAIKLLKKGFIHLIGSDTHNLKTRPPRLDEACLVIEKKLGEQSLHALMNFSEESVFKSLKTV